MTQDEGGMVHATLVVTRADNVSTWTDPATGYRRCRTCMRANNRRWYVRNKKELPELIASGVQEAEVQVLMQELEEDLDGLQTPEG